MKRIIAICMMFVFALSIVSMAWADDGEGDEYSMDNSANASVGVTDDAEISIREDAQAKARLQERMEAMKEKVKERFDRMREQNSERLAKIEGITQEQIDRLSKIEVRNIEKIAQLKKDRLDRLAKISGEKLERISELDKDKLEKIADLSEEEIKKAAILGRARLKELAMKENSKLKAALKNLEVFKVKSHEELSARKIDDSEMKMLNEKFEEAKERFQNARMNLEEAKKRLKEARESNDANETFEYAKGYLINASSVLISHLEKLKARVQESSNIPDDIEAKIVAEIDEQIADLNKLKSDIQAAATKDQLKEYAKSLRSKWKMLKHMIKHHTQRVISSRVEGVINRGIVLEKRLDHILYKAKNQSVEINVSAEVAAFSDKIAESRDFYKQAQAKLAEALDLRSKGEPADSEKIKNLLSEADALLKKSRDSLKEAYDTLKTIVSKIKDAMPDEEISAEVEVEVTTESD